MPIRSSALLTAILLLISAMDSLARQASLPKQQTQATTLAQPPPPLKAEQPPREPNQGIQEKGLEQRSVGDEDDEEQEQHFDMTEAPPAVTHHEIRLNGRLLHYTATACRLPIKEAGGKTDALMFYVAYTLENADPATRPLTFAFNGGPGSASIWLHMGALGPRTVVLQKDGFLPAAPYRLQDNPNTLLDKTDIVLIDAIGTGFSRPATPTVGKKFWSLTGDIQSFGEFVRLYITRTERWSSPLYLFGESYGTARAAGVSGYLANRGISFNGIVLLSTVLAFESLEISKTNDEPYPLLLPTYTMIAAYHHKLAPELSDNLERTRAEVEHWASSEYTLALAKGDALTPQERQATIEGLARYTGLSKEIIDQYNLRIDVPGFTHYLLADQKLRVGRLDGRFSGPDPGGFADTRFFDPTSAQTGPPFTSVLNDYIRRELGYKTDMPYYVMASDAWGSTFKWSWGDAGAGWADTAAALREAIVMNPFLKVHVLEGYYDLATPYYAVNFTMDHLNLTQHYRNNISYATFASGHMLYLDADSLKKMKDDVGGFIDQTLAPTR
jgi:carboxypeptidase C (cathepsin A)